MTMRINRMTLMGIAGVVFAAGVFPLAHGQDGSESAPVTMKWKEYGSAGSEHDLLRGFEGTWKRQIKWRQGLNERWQLEFTTCKNEMVLGGRFLKQQVEFAGSKGTTVRALSYLGYDTVKKQFVETKMENTSNRIATSEASFDASKHAFTFKRTKIDAGTGELKSYRSVLTIYHDDAYGELMYELDEQGKEFVSREMQYNRDIGTAEKMRQKRSQSKP